MGEKISKAAKERKALEELTKDYKIEMRVIENKILITGNFCPKPYERPRRGRYKSVFDPIAEYKNIIKELFKKACEENDLIEPYYRYMEVKSHFIMKIPESFSNKKKLYAYKNILKPLRKDIDNIEKTVYDCMNKIVYVDDGQIFRIESEKEYGVKDSFMIEINLKEIVNEVSGRMNKEEQEEWKCIEQFFQTKK